MTHSGALWQCPYDRRYIRHRRSVSVGLVHKTVGVFVVCPCALKKNLRAGGGNVALLVMSGTARAIFLSENLHCDFVNFGVLWYTRSKVATSGTVVEAIMHVRTPWL